jgi:hypothetical protein
VKQLERNREEREALPRCKGTNEIGKLVRQTKVWTWRETQYAAQEMGTQRENTKPETLPY